MLIRNTNTDDYLNSIQANRLNKMHRLLMTDKQSFQSFIEYVWDYDRCNDDKQDVTYEIYDYLETLFKRDWIAVYNNLDKIKCIEEELDYIGQQETYNHQQMIKAFNFILD